MLPARREMVSESSPVHIPPSLCEVDNSRVHKILRHKRIRSGFPFFPHMIAIVLKLIEWGGWGLVLEDAANAGWRRTSLGVCPGSLCRAIKWASGGWG
jgi:hypothetical protein